MEKRDIPIKIHITETMMARILRVMRDLDYNQSEYIREAIRRDLEARDRELVSQHLADPDSAE